MNAAPAPPPRAIELGHALEWDPPAALTAAMRWTCVICTATAIDYCGNHYGSATEGTCAEERATWEALGYGRYLPTLQQAQQDAIAAMSAKSDGDRCAWCREHAVDEIEVDIARGRDQRAYDGMTVCSACGRTQP